MFASHVCASVDSEKEYYLGHDVLSRSSELAGITNTHYALKTIFTTHKLSP